MRNNVLAALAVACALASCGDDDSGQRPDTGISAHDEAVMLRIDTQVRKWNRAAAPWVKAFGGDDANRFLVVHERSLKPLNSVAARVEVGSRQIADRALRVLVIPIGDQYRGQFNAMVDIGAATRSGDQEAIDAALKRLRRANRRKGELALELVDRFPEFGRNF
jgi:hypothetical protein